jgi:pimeloyl-ACP methyl ester carboxylesterase
MSIVFAATYPDRTRALVLYGTLPRFVRAPDYPFGQTREERMRETEHDVQHWGTVDLAREWLGSQTVKDLVAGSGIVFDDRGAAELKGVPGEWRLYAVGDA